MNTSGNSPEAITVAKRSAFIEAGTVSNFNVTPVRSATSKR